MKLIGSDVSSVKGYQLAKLKALSLNESVNLFDVWGAVQFVSGRNIYIMRLLLSVSHESSYSWFY